MSDEKIHFYEQVMELEPGSKLFFPLAGLYFGNNQPQKALNVLKAGLEKHPEHFEAKLLLASILNHEGQDDQAAEIYQSIFSLLQTNHHFWKYVARDMARKGENDLSLAASFFERSTSYHSLSWTDVLKAGLKHLSDLSEDHSSEPAHKTDSTPETILVSDSGSSHDRHKLRQEKQDSVPMDSSHDQEEIEQDYGQQPSDSAQTAKPQTDVPETIALSEEVQDTLVDDHQEHILESQDSQEHADEIPDSLVSDLDNSDTHDSEQSFPKSPSDEPYLVDAETEKIEISADASQPEMPHPDEHELDAGESEAGDYDDPEELDDFDIESDARTRSMADILFGQEEYSKALDIYEELWRKSLPGSERNELEELIEKTRHAIGSELPHEATIQGSPEFESKELDQKDEAIDFLMALADRLEAKSAQTQPAGL